MTYEERIEEVKAALVIKHGADFQRLATTCSSQFFDELEEIIKEARRQLRKRFYHKQHRTRRVAVDITCNVLAKYQEHHEAKRGPTA